MYIQFVRSFVSVFLRALREALILVTNRISPAREVSPITITISTSHQKTQVNLEENDFIWCSLPPPARHYAGVRQIRLVQIYQQVQLQILILMISILVPGFDKGQVSRGDYDHLTTFLGAFYGGKCMSSNMGCLDFVSDCVNNQCSPRIYFWVLLALIPSLLLAGCCLCVFFGGCPWLTCLLSLFCCCCEGLCCCCGGDSKEEETSESER